MTTFAILCFQRSDPNVLHNTCITLALTPRRYAYDLNLNATEFVLLSEGNLIIIYCCKHRSVIFSGFLNANGSPNSRARVSNYGLMDQIAVLHWVQQNIALFGGDPDNVSLMGHGPGAACINFLMISPTVVPGRSMTDLRFELCCERLTRSQEMRVSLKIILSRFTFPLTLVAYTLFCYDGELAANHDKTIGWG